MVPTLYLNIQHIYFGIVGDRIMHLFGYNPSLPDIVLRQNSTELYQFS